MKTFVQKSSLAAEKFQLHQHKLQHPNINNNIVKSSINSVENLVPPRWVDKLGPPQDYWIYCSSKKGKSLGRRKVQLNSFSKLWGKLVFIWPNQARGPQTGAGILSGMGSKISSEFEKYPCQCSAFRRFLEAGRACTQWWAVYQENVVTVKANQLFSAGVYKVPSPLLWVKGKRKKEGKSERGKGKW